MILGILISDLSSSHFSNLQLWQLVVSYLVKVEDYDLRFVEQIGSQNESMALSSTILGSTLEEISEEYNTFRTGLRHPSHSAGSPLRSKASAYLTFGFPRCLSDPPKTVFSICDLNHWIRPDSYSEADRLQAQASTFGAMKEARGLLFWSADLLDGFERLFPSWLVETGKPYRQIEIPSFSIERDPKKLGIHADTSEGSQGGAIEDPSDVCGQSTNNDVARALAQFYDELGLTGLT
jgi:hypothetical protein